MDKLNVYLESQDSVRVRVSRLNTIYLKQGKDIIILNKSALDELINTLKEVKNLIK